MPSVLAYHRPTNLDEAANILNGSNRRVLAGGTIVVPEARQQHAEGVELVDLQGLGLTGIAIDGDRLAIGAMVRLDDLRTDDRVPELIREAAQRELPSALRNQATVGGTIAHADPESLLVAALLVHDTVVEIHAQPDLALGEYLRSERRGLVVGIRIETSGRGAIATTGRTPADTPIVAAMARSADSTTRVALTGVARTPILVDPDSPTAGLHPPGDFRGSSSYRTHLATVLTARALGEVK